MGGEREWKGADLVRGVAVAGDAVGADDDAADPARTEERGGGDVGQERDGDAVLQ